ncbi:hypothetical protein SZ47_13365 [Brachyspira hyodysenteriae]|uniref:Uncharacterized protein n=2 Tax=Brachyspira hyodysenteriae TaxID=159 RepID=A0A3B6VQE5_BRAHO|nr:hypothetical protein [Brachyspira hyodysenteriae]ANN62897.1 hypothetical protein BHYOB78_03180 [Brachyspira hyodysenteriae ATCC 27164]KLI22257.1 hypothetical protein SZ47_13365 [Brachyspira hyodysenteriae]KLI52718.1 hypothetical protein SZ43_07405 [Brachyspira hyodysenteriae]MCZ9926038.1 hypothetical protein [Brachyspira hyodysenteriae]TVL78695.1 hypothetical protein A9X81_03580 [Brachyspira hyodysenteriae]
MKENNIQDNIITEKTNSINDINNKIGKILENNLISNLIIIAIGFIASLAMTIYFYLKIVNIAKLIDGIYSTSNSNIFSIDIFYFYIFYFLCFSLIFYINKNFNLKNILITFLSVIFILIVDLSTSFFIRSVAIDNNDFFLQISIIKYIFSVIIFFIIIALSYNGFQVLNSKTISEFFTFSADISIFAVLIAGIVSTVFGIFAAIVIFLIQDIISSLDEKIIFKLILLSISFLSSIFPFLVYIVYKNMKTNISIYLSRILMPFSLLFIFILLILLLMPDIRPYDNRASFILYNIMLAIIVLNMFFIRIDYKSSIFTKAVYLILPIIAIIFDILVLTSSLYRLIEYGISPNKITLIGTNLVMLGNLIFITFFNIKSILIIFKKSDDIPNIKEITIGDTKSVFYIYLYGIWAFIACFIIPVLFSLFK